MDLDLELKPNYESEIEERLKDMPCYADERGNVIERVYNDQGRPIHNKSDIICAENFGDNFFCNNITNRCDSRGMLPVLPDPVKKRSQGMTDWDKFNVIVTVLKRDMTDTSLNIKKLSIYDHKSIRILLQDIELLISKISNGYIKNETGITPGAVRNIDLTVTYLKEIKSSIQQKLKAIEGAHDAENYYEFFKKILGISYLENSFDIVMNAVINNAAKIYVYGNSFLKGKPSVFQKNRRKNVSPLHTRKSITKSITKSSNTSMRGGSKKIKKTKRRKYKRKSKRKNNKRKTKKNI